MMTEDERENGEERTKALANVLVKVFEQKILTRNCYIKTLLLIRESASIGKK